MISAMSTRTHRFGIGNYFLVEPVDNTQVTNKQSFCPICEIVHCYVQTYYNPQYVEQKSNEHQKDMGNTITVLK